MTRPYARFYYDDFMREFPQVYADPVLGWTWMQMLVVAEKMWPATPEVPRSVKPRAFSKLVEAGLVLPVPPHGYRMRGLDAERTRRQESARNAARNRWGNADGTSDGHATAMPRRDEPRRDETKVPPPPAKRGRRSEGTAPRQVGDAPRQNGTAPRQQGVSPRKQHDAQKRGGLDSLASILARAAEAGRDEDSAA